jgi:PAS domain-containing protein
VPQHEIEVILMRELASYLATAVFVVDPSGTLIYYNEPAESLLGTRFDETGRMTMEEWTTGFERFGRDGQPLTQEQLPLVQALRNQRPAHGAFSIRGRDGVIRHLDVTAIPIIGQAGRHLGAAALFWEVGGQ